MNPLETEQLLFLSLHIFYQITIFIISIKYLYHHSICTCSHGASQRGKYHSQHIAAKNKHYKSAHVAIWALALSYIHHISHLHYSAHACSRVKGILFLSPSVMVYSSSSSLISCTWILLYVVGWNIILARIHVQVLSVLNMLWHFLHNHQMVNYIFSPSFFSTH